MNLLEKLNERKVAKNTSVLLAAQIASRFMSIFYVAALARYVGAEGIGQISTATALTALLVLVVGPGLNTLLVRDVAANLGKASAYTSNMFLLKCVLGIPFILLTVVVASVAHYSQNTMLIVAIYALVYLIDALGATLAAVFQAFEHMEWDGATQVARDVINVALSLLCIYFRAPLLVIVLVSLVAQVCKLMLLMALGRRQFHLSLAVDFTPMKALFVSSLPLGVLLILHTVQVQLGTFVLSLYYPAVVVGFFAAANTLIGMLLLFVGSFSTAIFPTLSGMYVRAPGDLRCFYRVAYKFLLLVGFPLGLGTILLGEKVILLIYGNHFEASGSVIRILAIFLFTVVGYCNGPLLNATGRQNFFAITQGLAVCLNGLLCVLLVPPWGMNGAAIGLVCSGIVTFFVHSIACHRQLGLHLPWLTMARVLIATLVMGGAIQLWLSLDLPWLLAVFVIAPLTYGAVCKRFGILKRDELSTLSGAPHSKQTMAQRIPV